jgi:CBS domain-containing protein
LTFVATSRKMPATDQEGVTMTIKSILQQRSGPVYTLSGDTLVVDAVRDLSDKRIGAMPVVDQGAVVGIFSERDVVYGLAQDGDAFLRKTVTDVMIKPVVTVTAAFSLRGY